MIAPIAYEPPSAIARKSAVCFANSCPSYQELYWGRAAAAVQLATREGSTSLVWRDQQSSRAEQ